MLDRGTLRLLADNRNIANFSPELKEHLNRLYRDCPARVGDSHVRSHTASSGLFPQLWVTNFYMFVFHIFILSSCHHHFVKWRCSSYKSEHYPLLQQVSPGSSCLSPIGGVSFQSIIHVSTPPPNHQLSVTCWGRVLPINHSCFSPSP